MTRNSKTAIKIIGVMVGIGAIIPPLWMAVAYSWQAAGLRWEAPMELTLPLMLLWPFVFEFNQVLGTGPIDPAVFAISLGLAVIFNAALYGVIGFLAASAWWLGKTTWRYTTRVRTDQST